MYKCCRWCNNFRDGVCYSENFKNAEIDFDSLRDDGVLREVLKEYVSFSDDDISDIYKLGKELKISKPKLERLMDLIITLQRDMIDDVDEALDTAIVNNLSDIRSVYIENEYDFVCGDFK